MDKILTYHKVGVKFDSSLCWVDHYRFIKDLSYLQSLGLSFKTFDQLVSDKDENTVAITFDDGFAVITRYLDYFEQKNIKVTIFPIADFIGGFDDWDVSLMGFKFKHLNKKQILSFSNRGHEIGSHGRSHQALTLLDNLSLKNELEYSKRILEDITGKECKSISVPFGRIDKRVYDFCLEAGYRNVLTIGRKSFDGDNLYRTKSVYLGDTEYLISAKLGLNKFKSFEQTRLDIINKFSGGTILVKELFKRIKKI